ncbi:MAG TPA: hypothetical protein VF595_16100 [Tepidisphaeraceae bacterium]
MSYVSSPRRSSRRPFSADELRQVDRSLAEARSGSHHAGSPAAALARNEQLARRTAALRPVTLADHYALAHLDELQDDLLCDDRCEMCISATQTEEPEGPELVLKHSIEDGLQQSLRPVEDGCHYALHRVKPAGDMYTPADVNVLAEFEALDWAALQKVAESSGWPDDTWSILRRPGQPQLTYELSRRESGEPNFRRPELWARNDAALAGHAAAVDHASPNTSRYWQTFARVNCHSAKATTWPAVSNTSPAAAADTFPDSVDGSRTLDNPDPDGLQSVVTAIAAIAIAFAAAGIAIFCRAH